MKRVLVPLDGTGPAEAALAQLEEICDAGDEIVLLSVREPASPPRRGSRPGVIIQPGTLGTGVSGGGAVGPDRPVFAETAGQSLQRQADEMKDYLEDQASTLRRRGFKVETVVLIDEKPAEAILNYAGRVKPTFIAMVKRSHRGLAEMLFGSVATAIVKAEVAPVLLIPAKLD